MLKHTVMSDIQKYSMRGGIEWQMYKAKVNAEFDMRPLPVYCIYPYIMSKQYFNWSIILRRKD